jgi:predicted AlkP superfamily pyrophosphatase or phosphodiesterase
MQATHFNQFAIMRFFAIIIFLSVSFSVIGQSTIERPKLVVGIVVDQMRQEYLLRFHGKFGNDGFKRLMGEGYMLKNAHYNYVPTYTGPGHASIYTGTTPGIHGIIGNDFYEKVSKEFVNCVGDNRFDGAGAPSRYGKVAPTRLMSTTITDELKLFTNNKAKVIGVSIKDRGAVLPAGHMADAAYWFDKTTGKFMTSTFYMEKLPEWVHQFNSKNLAEIYLSQEWKPLLPIDQYTESGADLSPYERNFSTKDKTVFPYDLKTLRKGSNYDFLNYTPFSNDLVTEMAKTTLTAEKMGKDAIPDFLCISFSATDYLGHAMGPRAVELEDMYLRLDRNIADLLKKLDQEVGANNYVVFLSADHAAADVPQFLRDNKVPAGYFSQERTLAELREFLEGYFPGKHLIENFSNEQIFLNHEAFAGSPKTTGLDYFIVTELIGKFLMTREGVANYYTEGVIRQGRFDEEGHKGMVIRGFHPKRSGDVMIVLEPGWLNQGSITGTTHGSAYTYDTHVPVLFYGKGVKKGFSTRYQTTTDIAPTLSMLLNITLPSGCTGKPVSELFE